MEISNLIQRIREWQAAAAKYDAACEEARQINNGMHYPSSPARRSAIKALDAIAMEMIHDVHNDGVLETFVAMADEIERLQQNIASVLKKPQIPNDKVGMRGYDYIEGYNTGIAEAQAELKS